MIPHGHYKKIGGWTGLNIFVYELHINRCRVACFENIGRPLPYILETFTLNSGSGSSVGKATGYGLDGPGIEPSGGAVFRTRPDRPWGPSSLLYNGCRVFPGGKAVGAWCWPPTSF
jgi:hypothetical protein